MPEPALKVRRPLRKALPPCKRLSIRPMEQSMKTDQQLYEACLELLNNEVQEEVTVEDTEAEVEVEVVPDEEFVEEETAEN